MPHGSYGPVPKLPACPPHRLFPIRMLANIALDGFVGAVPLVGDAFDVMWRSNRRNVQLLREWLAREEGYWRRSGAQAAYAAPSLKLGPLRPQLTDADRKERVAQTH